MYIYFVIIYLCGDYKLKEVRRNFDLREIMMVEIKNIVEYIYF